MDTLSKLLERFSKSLNKDLLIKTKIIETIKETTNITLPQDKLSIKEGVLKIETTPVFKNELRLKEELWLKRLKTEAQISISRVLYK